MKKLSPLKAIRAKCLDCSCQNKAEVKNCVIKKCSLYPFRMGKGARKSKEMTQEQKVALAIRFQKARENKKSPQHMEKNTQTPLDPTNHTAPGSENRFPLTSPGPAI